MGESDADRCIMLVTLANMDPQPKSVPIMHLLQLKALL